MKKFLEHPVVATVVGGLILAAFTWAFGLLPTIWEYAKVGGSWLLGHLAIQFNTPLWFLLLVAGFISYLLVWQHLSISKNRKLQIELSTTGNADEHEEIPVKVAVPELSDEEAKLLGFLVRKDGAPSNFGELRHRLNMPKLHIEQMLEALERLTLVEVHENYFHGPQIVLTKVGRDYVLGNKFERAYQGAQKATK